MATPLRVLLVEDAEDDALLLAEALRGAGYAPELERVETAEAMAASLDRQGWDVVIADYTLPHFSAPAALALLRRRCLDLPFLVVSGAVGEEAAVATMRAGAHDFVAKGRLARLGPTIQRELREAQERQARRRAEDGQRRLAFLAQVSALLGSSLDYETILVRLARLAAPELADLCLVDLADADGALLRLAAQPDDAEDAEAPPRPLRWSRPDAPHGPFRVLHDGRAEVLPQVSDAELADLAPDLDWLARLHPLGVHAWMCVPLAARERTLGTLTFLSTSPERPYGRADLALAEDLAHRVALALDNARLHRELQQALHTRDGFLASVAHDLKTPIAAIKGRAQLLKGRAARLAPADAERLVAGLTDIDALTNRMTHQLNELLDLAHLQMGVLLALDRRRLDLATLVRRAAERARVARRHSLRLEGADTPLEGQWDGPRLERVLDNLLENAVKYSPAGGEVRVRLARRRDGRGEWAVLRVEDRGIGIPAADLPYIFERFRRGSNVVGTIPGSGTGLAGAKQIVEQHGGSIAAESVEGAGSTFTVRLPLEPPAENLAAAPDLPPP